MVRLTLRGLQSRKRQFAVAVIGAALVFAMALVLSGLSGGFRSEARKTVAASHADAFLVPRGTAGPFSTGAGIPMSWTVDVARVPGVRQADPVAYLHQSMSVGRATVNILMIGHVPGRLGTPPVARGRPVRHGGEAVVDQRGGVGIGGHISIGGQVFRVVGITHGLTATAGLPDVFIPLSDAQQIFFGGRPLATSIAVRGTPASAPPGLTTISVAAARADLERPLRKGVAAVDHVQVFLWIVAAVIIGVVVYLSALERVGDFAVLKALGTSSRTLFMSLALEAVVTAVVAAGVAELCARALVPVFPIPVDIPRRGFLLLPVVAVVVGVLASLGGLRRAIASDPARAFASG